MTKTYQIGDQVREISTGDIGTVTRILPNFEFDVVYVLWKDNNELQFDSDHDDFEIIEIPIVDDVLLPEQKRHKHADVIIAWANGTGIQLNLKGKWRDIEYPTFYDDCEYRVKPKMVDKWLWFAKDEDKFWMTDEHFTEQSIKDANSYFEKTHMNARYLQKVDSSKITVEE